MKLRHLLFKEKGYLLMESMVALVVISTILLIIYPLSVNWLVYQATKEEEVEMTRVLYEQSVSWPMQTMKARTFEVKQTEKTLQVLSPTQNIGIEIYDTQFE